MPAPRWEMTTKEGVDAQVGVQPPIPHRRILGAQRQLARGSLLLERVLVVAAGTLLVYLCVALFLQVVFRYILFRPLPWSEESARFAMVWFGMLAAAVAARKGQHFVFRWGTLLAIPPRVRPWLRQLINLVIVVFLIAVFFQSLRYLEIVANQTAQATGLNMRIPHAGVTAGVVAMILIYLLELADSACSWFTGQSIGVWEGVEERTYGSLSGEVEPDPLRTEQPEGAAEGSPGTSKRG